MADVSKHIVAMGGGGFLMEPDNPLLDDFVLSLAARKPARVCFITTASGDSPTVLLNFYRAFAHKSLATDMSLFASGLPEYPAISVLPKRR